MNSIKCIYIFDFVICHIIWNDRVIYCKSSKTF